MIQTDTIVAIATGAARGGIGIIRLSGPQAFAVAQRIFSPTQVVRPPWESHRLMRGVIVDPQGSAIDEGFAVRMAQPNTYTGEEVVELHAHGSPVALARIVSQCVSAGARVAAPGEFTKRAYLNGKIDLVQAEAIAEFIAAESDGEASAANRRIKGNLSKSLTNLRLKTIELLAECEADVDFPEELLPLASRASLVERLRLLEREATELAQSYATNQRLHDGFSVALVGRPNVGKSSLFNALLHMDRAIVTPVAGTTRDALREEIVLEGIRMRLIDTAGLRSSSHDPIEKMGIARSKQELESADLVCFVCDAGDGWTDEDETELSIIHQALGKNQELCLLWNKIDICLPPTAPKYIPIQFKLSALKGSGLSEFRQELARTLGARSMMASHGGISNDRQFTLINDYVRSVRQAQEQLRGKSSPEFVAFELRAAHRSISKILGQDEGMEEVLGEIFSRFCVGK